MTDAAVHTITSDSDSDSFSFPSSSATTVSINNSNQPSRPCTPPKEIVPVPHPHSPTFENQNEHWKFVCKIYEALKIDDNTHAELPIHYQIDSFKDIPPASTPPYSPPRKDSMPIHHLPGLIHNNDMPTIVHPFEPALHDDVHPDSLFNADMFLPETSYLDDDSESVDLSADSSLSDESILRVDFQSYTQS